MPGCGFVPRQYEGISLERVKKIRKAHLNPAIQTQMQRPPFLWKGHMQWLWDVFGKRYLDMFGCFVTVGVGHSHPHVTKAAKQQMDDLWHTTNVFLNPYIHEYVEKLAATLPGDLKVCYFVNSGSEANELAMMMARLHTGSHDLVSLRNGYHGAGPWSVGLTSLGSWKHNLTTGSSCLHSMNPDVYRGLWGGARCRDSVAQTQRQCDCLPGECKASEMYADQLEELLYHSAGKRIAGFFSEVIQGAGGAIQLPKGFLRRAYESVRKRGGLCIADEVQTGFGRLGSHFWGFQTQGVMPDIVTTAKTIGNGFPLAAVITTHEVARSLTGANHFNTFGGNPIACTVGKSVLEVIERENLQENAALVGTYLLEGLLSLRDEFPDCVGDVRGKGMMLGLELICDKELKTRMPIEQVHDIWENIKDMGVIVGKAGLHGNIFRVTPPMIVTHEDVDFTVAVFRRALQHHVDVN